MSTFAQILAREIAKQQAEAEAAERRQHGIFTFGWGVLVEPSPPRKPFPFSFSDAAAADYAAARRERKGGV